MTAIDRQQIIEDAARAMHNTAGWWPWERLSTEEPLWAEGWRDNAKAALPVIVAAALKPIRELHAAGEPVCVETGHTPSRCPCSEVFCEGCGESMPCPTVRLLDEIESSAKGGDE